MRAAQEEILRPIKSGRPEQPLSVGSAVEVQQREEGMSGARYAAKVLVTGRGDKLVQVQYQTLFESENSELLLSEWVRPVLPGFREKVDFDQLRPTPPEVPDGFHSQLRPGDTCDLAFDAGWWPVKARAVRRAALPSLFPVPT